MTLISGSFQGKQLALMQEASYKPLEEAWNAHPVHLTEKQTAIVRPETGIALLENRVVMPTAMANLQPHQVQPLLLLQIDAEYRQAIATYKKELNQATALDLEEHAVCYKKYEILEDYPLIARIFMEIAGKDFIDRSSFEQRVQFARQAWFTKVATAEDARLASVKEKITTAVILKFRQLKLPTQVSNKVTMEAWQLTQVYEALFPKDANADVIALKALLPDNDSMQKKLD